MLIQTAQTDVQCTHIYGAWRWSFDAILPKRKATTQVGVCSYNRFAFRFTNLNGTEDPTTASRFPSTAVTRVRLSLVCLCLRLFVVFLQHNISKRKTMGPLCFQTHQNQTATYIESNRIESNLIELTLTAHNSAVTSSSHTLESWILGRCFPCHHLPLDSL